MSRMSRSRIILWGLFTVLLCLPLKSHAQTINAASCSSTDVQTALNSVNADGTTVNIPAGTCTWTSTLTYNQVFSTAIIGAGNLSVVGGGDITTFTDSLNSDNPILLINTAAGKSFRLSGITFRESGVTTTKYEGTLRVAGNSTAVRLDHLHFVDINVTSLRLIHVYGVFDHSIINMGGNAWNGIKVGDYGASGEGDETWAAPTNFGSSHFFYFEDNIIDTGAPNDCDHGGKFVFRHNTFTNVGGLQTHPTGGSGADARGCRAWEIYQNTFTASGTPFNAMYASSGTGLFWGNTVAPGYNHVLTFHSTLRNSNTYSEQPTPTGWGYCGTSFSGTGSNWDGNTNGSTGYPCIDQPGRGQGQLLTGLAPNKVNSATGTISWPHQALEPVYEWMTTGWSGSTNNYAISYESDVVVNNQDYYLWCDPLSANGCTSNNGTHGVGSGLLSARPSTCTPMVAYWATDQNTLYQCVSANTWTPYYKPYTYPHPLVSGSGAQTVTPPSNLNAIVQ